MKKCLSILAIGLLFLTSCLNELQGDREEATGPSNIVINISAKPQTKLGTASDGDVMSNLHIWLVYGTTVKGYLRQGNPNCTISGTGSTATATFENVPRGACTLYLVANLPEDSTLPTDYRVGGKAIDDAFLKYVLPAVVDYEPPYGDSTPGMPLSTSVSLSVGAGTNRVSAELVRTCAKLSITVRNNTTNNTIILKDLIFTNKNPNVGYLFGQSDYSIPGTASFGPFMSITHSSGAVSDVIPQGGERTYIQQYMYETATNGAADLGFEIVGGLFPDGTDKATVGEVSINTLSFVNSFSTGSSFLIKSSNNDLYLYDNNGTLALQSLSSFNSIPKGYLWTISGNRNSATIKGSSGKYLKLSSSGASLGSTTNLKVSTSSGSFKFFYTSGSTYYLTINGSSLTTTTTSTESNTYWKIATVESKTVTNFQGATVIFDKTISSLNYINKYGIPVPLEQIRRNQDVKIVVNIHYNPNSGVLYFETSDWVDDDKEHETTFD